MNRYRMKTPGALPVLTAALAAAGLLSTSAHAQVQSAGTLFVNVDATQLPEGPLQRINNTGSLGGVFEAIGGEGTIPVIAAEGGTKGIRLDGTDFLQHLSAAGGSPVIAPEGLTGDSPTRSIEVWAFNPQVAGEETLVSWGRRGGPDGSNMSFNYGSDFRWGAVGHWGNPDIGWNSAGGSPAAGQWHHLVYTFDGTTTRVYSDGVLANAEIVGGGRINTHPDTPINIGAQMEGDAVTVTGGLRFSGNIARVRVHDDVLTPAQVKNNYDFEKAAFINPEPPPPIAAERLTKSPIHRYSFSEPAAANAAGLEFRDSIGTAHGRVLGEGTAFTGSRLTLSGGPSATAGYGDLPNGMLSSHGVANGGTGEFTFETWIKITGSQNWSRIVDIGSTVSDDGTGELHEPGGGGTGLDYFIYSAQNGGDTGTRRLEVRNEDPGGGGIATSDNATTTFNTDTHVAITWDERVGRLQVFQNGALVNTLNTAIPMSEINDVNVWLGRSNWTADNNTQGEYDEVRFYDFVLTPGQAFGNTLAGPDLINDRDVAVTIAVHPESRTVPETLPVTFRVDARGSSPVSFQWFRNGSAISGATASTYTVNTVSAADNGAQFTVEVSNSVNGTPARVTSNPATLSVISDTLTLKHRYSFNESSGTQITDSVGSAHGTAVGSAVLGGGQLTLDGQGNAYGELPNGIVTGLGVNGTIEMWTTYGGSPFGTSIVWSRLFDFGISDQGEGFSGAGVDYLFYTPRDGDGIPRFVANFPGGGDAVNMARSGFTPVGEEEHIVITYSSTGGVARIYSNGVLLRTVTGTLPPLSAMNNQDVNNWLGRSQFVADADFTGSYNEFRLYSGAMTPSQVAASHAAGPNNLPSPEVPAPQLAAEISGSNLNLSWPAEATGFQLESTTALGTGAAWTAAGNGTVSGGRFRATVPIDGTARYFRLRN